MLARELGISKASALLPVTMPTHRAQNLHKRKGRPQSHSPSKDSDRELERGSNRAAPGARVDGQHPGIESGYVMEGDVLLKVLRPLQSPALRLAFDGLHGEHRGFFQHSQVRILAPRPEVKALNSLPKQSCSRAGFWAHLEIDSACHLEILCCFVLPASAETLMGAFPRAKMRRQITPWNARALAVEDRIDKQPIIRRRAADMAVSARKKVFDPVPFVIPQSSPVHRSAPKKADLP